MAAPRVVDETARFTPVGHQAGAQKASGFRVQGSVEREKPAANLNQMPTLWVSDI